MCGDMDANGEIRASDAQKIWNRAENPDFYLDSHWAADVDCNGEISTNDAEMVWMRVVDTSYDLNCCCDNSDGWIANK